MLAPLERREELATLFANKKVALIGSQGVLTPSWTASLDKMYDLFYVYELVQKYIDHGEVGVFLKPNMKNHCYPLLTL